MHFECMVEMITQYNGNPLKMCWLDYWDREFTGEDFREEDGYCTNATVNGYAGGLGYPGDRILLSKGKFGCNLWRASNELLDRATKVVNWDGSPIKEEE